MPSLKQVVEALVFASQKPLMPGEIIAAIKSAATADTDDADARAFAKAAKEAQIAALLQELKVEYIELQRAFQLVEQVDGWALVSDPACARWVRQLFPESKPARLSGPALETLAIIAYRQPIMRADIEAVRGVAVDGMVQSLMERQLIRITGRADVPGRPLLYETTEVFLKHFGLRSLDELPNVAELRRMNLPTAPAPAPAAEVHPPSQTQEAAPVPAEGAETSMPATGEADERAAGDTSHQPESVQGVKPTVSSEQSQPADSV